MGSKVRLKRQMGMVSRICIRRISIINITNISLDNSSMKSTFEVTVILRRPDHDMQSVTDRRLTGN